MHFLRLTNKLHVCFSVHGKQSSQSLQDLAVMVLNPAGAGICGIEKETERGEKKISPAQASEAVTETSKRQLEIENAFAPAPSPRS